MPSYSSDQLLKAIRWKASFMGDLPMKGIKFYNDRAFLGAVLFDDNEYAIENEVASIEILIPKSCKDLIIGVVTERGAPKSKAIPIYDSSTGGCTFVGLVERIFMNGALKLTKAIEELMAEFLPLHDPEKYANR